MAKFKFKSNYDPSLYRTDTKTDKNWNLKVTEPGQSISVRKLVERYEKGTRGTWKLPVESE